MEVTVSLVPYMVGTFLAYNLVKNDKICLQYDILLWILKA